MPTWTFTTTDPIIFNVDVEADGSYVVIGETVPMLLVGKATDEDGVRRKIDDALRDMLLYIGESGPEKLVRFLADRGVDGRGETDDGRSISRESFKLPDLAISAT